MDDVGLSAMARKPDHVPYAAVYDFDMFLDPGLLKDLGIDHGVAIHSVQSVMPCGPRLVSSTRCTSLLLAPLCRA